MLNKSGKPYKRTTLDGHESGLRLRLLPLADPATDLPLGATFQRIACSRRGPCNAL